MLKKQGLKQRIKNYLKLKLSRSTTTHPKYKTTGINLIGLMISSALGAFILAAIIKVAFTVSDNLQLINAITELEGSARVLDQFFNKAIVANGYNNVSANINNFILSTNNDLKLPLWFTGGNANAITCSGQPASNSASANITIFMKHPTTTGENRSGYITCLDSSTPPTSWDTDQNGATNMPLVGKAQIADFYAVLSVINNASPSNIKMANVPIIYSNISDNTYTPFALHLAILLKSTSPVFNTTRSIAFNNILTRKNFNNGSGDQYLYKLVMIQVPFVYTDTTNTIAKISTS